MISPNPNPITKVAQYVSDLISVNEMREDMRYLESIGETDEAAEIQEQLSELTSQVATPVEAVESIEEAFVQHASAMGYEPKDERVTNFFAQMKHMPDPIPLMEGATDFKDAITKVATQVLVPALSAQGQFSDVAKLAAAVGSLNGAAAPQSRYRRRYGYRNR